MNDRLVEIIKGYKVCDVPQVRIDLEDATELATPIHQLIKGKE